jgi:hypothetical protein
MLQSRYLSARSAMEDGGDGGGAACLMRPLSLRLSRPLKPRFCSRCCSSRDSSGSKSFHAVVVHTSAHPTDPVADESIGSNPRSADPLLYRLLALRGTRWSLMERGVAGPCPGGRGRFLRRDPNEPQCKSNRARWEELQLNDRDQRRAHGQFSAV